MELQKYLDTYGFTLEQMAQVCDVTLQAIGNYARKERRPEPDIARKIVEFTKGEVSWEDLYSYKPMRKTK